MMRHGWFIIPGRQTGDRTLEEQRTGVERALSECKGKRVLDLGCAEGLLSLEFARAGARAVHCVDSVGEHLTVAQDICSSHRNMTFQQMNLNTPEPLAHRFDIVLALGVAHKLREPRVGIAYAAQSSDDLVLVRMTRYADAVLTSKFTGVTCDVRTEMYAQGFWLQFVEPGPRQETVHYYRKYQGARPSAGATK